MMLLLFSGVLLLLGWYFYYYKPFRYWQSVGVQPVSNYPCIFLGDFWPIFLGQMNFNDAMDKFYYKRPTSRYEAVYHLSTPALVIKDCDLIKQLLVKEFDHFTDHFNFAPSDGPDGLWSQNLINLKGNSWKDMRSVLSGAFTSSKMKILYGLISETSEGFVDYFKKNEKEIVHVELKDCFTRLMTDVVATTAFGIKVDSLRDPNNEFYVLGKKVTNFNGFGVVVKFFIAFLFPWLARQMKIVLFPKDATDYFCKLIDEALTIREKEDIVRPDMLHLLLQMKLRSQPEDKTVASAHDEGFAVAEEEPLYTSKSQKTIQITNRNIAAQALAFFVGGFDTTSNAMGFTTYELAVNPEIQNKLRNEVEKTLEKNNGKIDYEALLGMKYLDMVVTESLRKWPPIMATDRVCVKPFTIEPTSDNEKPITLQPGQRIIIPFNSIQRDPNYFPDPEKFDPERFSEENKGSIIPYSFISFGVGPRNCIGSRLALLEVKTVLVWLLRNFEIVATEKTPKRLELDKKAISTSVKDGFPVGLKRLKNKVL